ncbi:hypothetical protein GQ53DRAFT_770612 [Thozetella sp. PMI_491]|nr:hypothetical protein GQ53DRAFT_770612 [Thozetella sp. PMI_491]
MPFFLVDKTPYSPAVSSPLNPESCYEIPRKNARRCKAIRLSGRKIPNPISPTQKLLRQKAEAAWRSEKGHFTSPPRSSLDNQAHKKQSLQLRISIDRATVVTVIPISINGKVFQHHPRDAFHDDQEGLILTHKRGQGAAAARKVLLIMMLLCVLGLATVFRLRVVLGRPPIIS